MSIRSTTTVRGRTSSIGRSARAARAGISAAIIRRRFRICIRRFWSGNKSRHYNPSERSRAHLSRSLPLPAWATNMPLAYLLNASRLAQGRLRSLAPILKLMTLVSILPQIPLHSHYPLKTILLGISSENSCQKDKLVLCSAGKREAVFD